MKKELDLNVLKEGKVNTHKDIPKRTKNAILKRIEGIVAKHGYKEFKLVTKRYIEDITRKDILQKQIEEKEAELKALKLNK